MPMPMPMALMRMVSRSGRAGQGLLQHAHDRLLEVMSSDDGDDGTGVDDDLLDVLAGGVAG